MHKFDELLDILNVLRAPGGCAWDRKQTLGTMAPKLLEEAQEAAHAVDNGDMKNLCEELGDLLITACFMANIAREEQSFTMEDCLQGAIDKLVRRHPHVFGDQKDLSAEQVLEQWHRIKEQEKQRPPSHP